MKSVARLLCVLAFGTLSAPADARELNRVQEVGAEIRKCWRPPERSEGQELTVTFSFKRNGELVGKPRITYSKLKGDEDLQKAFVGSVLQALASCTPLQLSDGLGGAIAGRPFAMRFVGTARGRDI